jgi:hypothetical protein
LTWDSSGENFLSPSNPSRLWSSSTQFSVEVVRVQEMNGDKATGTLEPGSRSASETLLLILRPLFDKTSPPATALATTTSPPDAPSLTMVTLAILTLVTVTCLASTCPKMKPTV